MSEVPRMKVNLDGEKKILTPGNAALYLHMGQLAMFDHIYIVPDSEQDEPAHMFRPVTPMFNDMANYMAENQYPIHMYLRNVLKQDIEAYKQMIDRQQEAVEIGDTIPADWDA